VVTVDPLGTIVGVAIIAAISSTLYTMLHAPSSRTEMIAAHAAEQAQEITGVILVVFSSHIHSEVLMALAVRMAKGRQAQLVAIYIIEVPLTLPIDAELPQEERAALEVLTAAEAIGRCRDLHHRSPSHAPHRRRTTPRGTGGARSPNCGGSDRAQSGPRNHYLHNPRSPGRPGCNCGGP